MVCVDIGPSFPARPVDARPNVTGNIAGFPLLSRGLPWIHRLEFGDKGQGEGPHR